MQATKETWIVRILKAGAVYFSLVFAVGFVLGVIRTSWVAAHFGTRLAELAEMPVMLVAVFVASHWTVARFDLPSAPSFRIGMGCVALLLMLIAEFGFVLWLRGLTITDYLAARDPVSGTAYYLMLVIFAVVPY